MGVVLVTVGAGIALEGSGTRAASPPSGSRDGPAGVFAGCTSDATRLEHYVRVARRISLRAPDSVAIVGYGAFDISPGGRMLLLDDGDYNVKIFAPDGSFQRVLGKRGARPGGFQHPAAAAFLDDTTVTVVDDVRLKRVTYSTRGRLLSEDSAPLRPVGGVLAVGDELWVAGLGPVGPGTPPERPLGLHRMGDDGPLESFVPLSPPFSDAPPLRANQLPLVAGARRRAGPPAIFMAWRLGTGLLRVSPEGDVVERVEYPSHASFANPLRVIETLPKKELRNILGHTSPIIRLAVSDRYLVVGYFASHAGESGFRYHLFDRDLSVVAGGLHGPAIYGGRGDSLIALIREEDAVRPELGVEVGLLIPCIEGAKP